MGDRAIASSKSGLHSDVPAGEVVSGYPAIPNSQWLKTSAIYRRLPEMQKLLRQIQSHLGLKD
jgi:UDP-3-O-[3-hydroxymyristoyl] glucosamine N-acyltransferase